MLHGAPSSLGGFALLIRGARVFAPEDLGRLDVLVSGDRIVAVAPAIPVPTAWPGVHVVEADGLLLLPGLVDGHLHPLGGGGDGGPHTRNRDVLLSELTTAGVTSVVGMLGTDCETRTMRDLLAKTRALQIEGLSAYCTTGGYPVPPPTFTGSVSSDLAFLDAVVGCGEVAISDHRSSQPTANELARLVSAARMGGRLAGKAGTTVIHLGDGKRALGPLEEMADQTDLPIDQVLPTHVNRSEALFTAAVAYAHRGGGLDLTATIAPSSGFTAAVDPVDGLQRLHAANIPIDQISVSSDANGNMPLSTAPGSGIRLSHHPPRVLYDIFRRAFLEGLSLPWLLAAFSTTPAKRFSLPRKGRIAAGSDADLLLVDDRLDLLQVYARGRLMVDAGQPIVRGTFEPDARISEPQRTPQ